MPHLQLFQRLPEQIHNLVRFDSFVNCVSDLEYRSFFAFVETPAAVEEIFVIQVIIFQVFFNYSKTFPVAP